MFQPKQISSPIHQSIHDSIVIKENHWGENQYSLLYFTSCFRNSVVKVKNSTDTIFQSLTTIRLTADVKCLYYCQLILWKDQNQQRVDLSHSGLWDFLSVPVGLGLSKLHLSILNTLTSKWQHKQQQMRNIVSINLFLSQKWLHIYILWELGLWKQAGQWTCVFLNLLVFYLFACCL